MPFVRAARVQTSTPALDHAEVQWWNAHADLIERIWGMSDALCRDTRADYLERVREIIREKCGRTRIHILEIACGSGWPGRLLADPDTRVTGVDFSGEQIRIAQVKAAGAGAENCSYICADVNGLPALLADGAFDATFIHCGIHHLSGDELRAAAKSLSAVPPGTPVVLVEPVYHDRRTALGCAFARLLHGAWWCFWKCTLSGLTPDRDIAARTQRLFDESDRASWFLSPKEMPFTLPELEAVFGSSFSIESVEVVTHFGLRLGQFLATIEDARLADSIGAKWLPLFNRIDRWLIRSGLTPRLSDQYFFTQVVLVRR